MNKLLITTTKHARQEVVSHTRNEPKVRYDNNRQRKKIRHGEVQLKIISEYLQRFFTVQANTNKKQKIKILKFCDCSRKNNL